ncbi:MAG: hypothetical protein ACW9W3_10025 [Candidatus Nitrosopumilus sp. bin_68KS]
MPSKNTKSNDMVKLLEKEKELHCLIRADFEKITQKIDDNFEKIIKSKSS